MSCPSVGGESKLSSFVITDGEKSGPPPKMAAPVSKGRSPGRQSANLFGSLSRLATWDEKESGEGPSPATPETPPPGGAAQEAVVGMDT